MIVKCICPTDHNRMFLGLEMGKIVEIIPETDKSPKVASLVYSGAHTVYDLVLDCQDRLLFFDGSYTLRMISYNATKTEEISSGEFWGSSLFTKTAANKSDSTESAPDCYLERATRYCSSSRSTNQRCCRQEVSDWKKAILQTSHIRPMASSYTSSLTTEFCTSAARTSTKTMSSTRVSFCVISEGQYFCMSVSADGKYLAVSSNFSDGTVTEHSIFVFELQATKDPLFVHKVTFMTDFAQDYLRQLNFEIQSKGEAILSGCTVNSCMLITFVLRNKKLEQYQKEFSLNDDPDSRLV